MKCFIHIKQDAISVCKKCGKAMCADCSAYSGHSGICPECRREEFERESAALRQQIAKNKSLVVSSIAIAVIVAVLAVLASIFINVSSLVLLVVSAVLGLRAVILINRCKPLNERLEFLCGEITKLNGAMQKGSPII